MNEISKELSIIAYYLSEYDMDAVAALGYPNRSAAIKDISVIMEHDNHFLKLRRDEFDALPDSASYRQGWNKRPPKADVVNMASYLKNFSFEQLTEMCEAIISNKTIEYESGSEEKTP